MLARRTNNFFVLKNGAKTFKKALQKIEIGLPRKKTRKKTNQVVDAL